MPFKRKALLPFTEVQILDFAPTEAGVLGLTNGEQWVYIRATENIQKLLLSIWHCDRIEFLQILSYNPSHFTFEKIKEAVIRKTREKHLVCTLDPPMQSY